MNKYRNKKTVIDGIRFDSKREAERYSELKLMEKANMISGLQLQPVFVEDVKGMKTDVFNIKRKMFLYKYPDIDFRSIK